MNRMSRKAESPQQDAQGRLLGEARMAEHGNGTSAARERLRHAVKCMSCEAESPQQDAQGRVARPGLLSLATA